MGVKELAPLGATGSLDGMQAIAGGFCGGGVRWLVFVGVGGETG